MCRLSIILSYYSGEKYFERQLNSIVSQLKLGDEILVRDDGTPSNSISAKSVLQSLDYMEDLLDSGVIRLIEGENLGVNQSLYYLCKHAVNDVIVFCDQDDVWLDGRLASVRLNSKSDLHIVNFECVSGVNKALGLSKRPSLLSIFLKNSIPGCAMSGRKELLLEYMSIVPKHQLYDHYIIFRALLTFKNITYDPCVRFRYFRHDETVTKYGDILADGFTMAIKRRALLFKTRK